MIRSDEKKWIKKRNPTADKVQNVMKRQNIRSTFSELNLSMIINIVCKISNFIHKFQFFFFISY